jgi:hypothetical protein
MSADLRTHRRDPPPGNVGKKTVGGRATHGYNFKDSVPHEVVIALLLWRM